MSEYAGWAQAVVAKMLADPSPTLPAEPPAAPPPEPPSDYDRLMADYKSGLAADAERLKDAPSWQRPATMTPATPRRVR